jgi:hypothetical protein
MAAAAPRQQGVLLHAALDTRWAPCWAASLSLLAARWLMWAQVRLPANSASLSSVQTATDALQTHTRPGLPSSPRLCHLCPSFALLPAYDMAETEALLGPSSPVRRAAQGTPLQQPVDAAAAWLLQLRRTAGEHISYFADPSSPRLLPDLPPHAAPYTRTLGTSRSVLCADLCFSVSSHHWC